MRLQYRVPLISAAVVLVIGLAAVPPLLYQLRRASLEQFGAMAAGVAQVLEGHLESSAASSGGHSVGQAVDELRGYPLLEDVVVFTSAGAAATSLHATITGAPADDSRIGEVIASGRPITESTSQGGVNRLEVITPILNKPACQNCHGADKTVLGAMLVSLNTASQDAELRNQLLTVALTGLAAFVLIELALTLSLKELVLNPLSRLGAAAGRISRGDYSAAATVERDDEVGALALALNQMAERVAEHTADLQERNELISTRLRAANHNMVFLLDFEARQRAELAGQHVEKLMAAQEEERKRVARELHDGTAQSLTSLLVGLKTLESVRSRQEFRARAGELERQVVAALDEVRRLACELRPAALDELGLAAALRGYLRETMNRYEVEIDFHADLLGTRLSPGLETALYRIVQESVANAIRHGEARRISVSLERRPAGVVARVHDDGKGFSTAALGPNGGPRHSAPGRGLGLIGMRERASLFGGSVRVESQPGAGTTILAEIPLVGALEMTAGGVNG